MARSRCRAASTAQAHFSNACGNPLRFKVNGTVSNGIWAFASGESQLVVTLSGQTQTQQIFALTATSLSAGYSFTQARVQAAVAGQPVPGVPNGLIGLILLSTGSFTFPAGTPPLNANQITSLELRTNLVPR